MFGKTNHIHFVGIGGIGMSGMAELLHKLGFTISGSDQNSSERTNNLQSMGLTISEGHSGENVNGADVVVYSSAVQQGNPEIIAAENKLVPVIRRAEMLAELLKVKPTSIAIAGTHGKTTTCSMLGEILTAAELNPTMVIGGIVNKFQSNTISGSGDVIVVEADEFDRSFLTLQPTMGLITNLDLEHLDCYENLEDLQMAFTQFANAVPFYGRVGVCIDNHNATSIIPNIKRPVVTFGVHEDAEIQASNLKFENNHSTFTLSINGVPQGELTVHVPGEHNVKNALGAAVLALELDTPFDKIQAGLDQYTGVRRRFDIKYTTDKNIMIVDDYAHHPTEVSATLKAAKTGWNNRVIAIFQPHLFTRTRDFYHDFAEAFLQADILIVTDIYQAREKPLLGITAQIISDEAERLGHKHVELIPEQTNIPARLKELVCPADMIITMGAGNIWRQCEGIYEAITN
ncbi:MAG: UDP-N-acetylmuramate--L-alanine ligase [Candidatus Marinimicrobia bacterium]|nr:UDP-N-acetylmuramate--L-alanine ligase [Candidatus Neomarinimicrobiota bacterium]